MSRSARRFFGCVLPLTLAVFGCAAMGLAAYAGQVFIQVIRIPDGGLRPPFEPGRTAIVDNTSFWTDPPWRGIIVTVQRPEGLLLRRVVGLPGDTLAVRDGRILIDGEDAGLAHVRGADREPIRLGANEYFLWADTADAGDSRRWGPVPREQILGRVFVVRDDHTGEVFPVRGPPRPEPSSGLNNGLGERIRGLRGLGAVMAAPLGSRAP